MFYSITHFRKALEELSKVKRGVYSGLEQEISNVFRNLSFDQISVSRDLINQGAGYNVIKLRVGDRKHKLSKSDGYRLIYIALTEQRKVVLLDVYPKRGPRQKINITAGELVERLKEYIDEEKSGILERYVLK